MVRTLNKPNQKTKNPIVRTVRFVKSEHSSSSVTQEKRQTCFVWLRKHQNQHGDKRKRRRRSNENGETCEEWTLHRFVHAARKLNIDLRVSGLPHAEVKQAENFRVRELVVKIGSHPHRKALPANLQKNNVCIASSTIFCDDR